MDLSVNKNNKKGFGLLEVLVSSSIIILVLGSVVFVGRQALANSTYSQQRAEAIFLAQEGLESVRQIRDTNWIDGSNKTEWDDLSYDNNAYTALAGQLSDNYTLKYFNNVNVKQRYLLTKEPSEETIRLDNQDYVRIINIATPEGTILPGNGTNDVHKDINALKVTVTVKWNFGGIDRTTNVSEVLTNWRPNF